MRINFIKENPDIPFPQANDIYKIIKYVNDIHHPNQQERFSNVELEVVPRQISYYKAAAQFLGLLEKNKTTDLSQLIFDLDNNFLFVACVNLILRNKVFGLYYQHRDKQIVEDYLLNIYKLNPTTVMRRLSTVRKWVDWCDIIIKENNLKVVFSNENLL